MYENGYLNTSGNYDWKIQTTFFLKP